MLSQIKDSSNGVMLPTESKTNLPNGSIRLPIDINQNPPISLPTYTWTSCSTPRRRISPFACWWTSRAATISPSTVRVVSGHPIIIKVHSRCTATTSLTTASINWPSRTSSRKTSCSSRGLPLYSEEIHTIQPLTWRQSIRSQAFLFPIWRLETPLRIIMYVWIAWWILPEHRSLLTWNSTSTSQPSAPIWSKWFARSSTARKKWTNKSSTCWPSDDSTISVKPVPTSSRARPRWPCSRFFQVRSANRSTTYSPLWPTTATGTSEPISPRVMKDSIMQNMKVFFPDAY